MSTASAPYRRAPSRAIVVDLVIRHFLGFRARAFSMALVCFGLAAAAPRGLKGFVEFLKAPPGLAVVALGLMAIGVSVEESGTIKRIRFGIGLRILATAVLVAAVIWGLLLGAPLPSLSYMGFALGGVGAIGVAIALQHDLAKYADVRHGEPVKLLELSGAGLDIEANGERVTVAVADILAASAVANLDGRAVIFLVSEAARRRRDMHALPWIGATVDGDAFVLTEHQAGMDADELVRRVVEAGGGMRGVAGR
ncbi:MAG: hypothetical protein IPM54_01065 [Polyangiaceae bacterium]|nr:hypothetical protein [Polyangiaceae bacterium]